MTMRKEILEQLNTLPCFNKKNLKSKIENLFDSKNFIDEFVKNFKALYERYKNEYLK